MPDVIDRTNIPRRLGDPCLLFRNSGRTQLTDLLRLMHFSYHCVVADDLGKVALCSLLPANCEISLPPRTQVAKPKLKQFARFV